MTKTRKKEIKRKLVKVLNIVSYILSGFMLIILVVCIVQGCSKKRVNASSSKLESAQQLIVNSQSQRVYDFNYALDSSISIDLQKQNEMLMYEPYVSRSYTSRTSGGTEVYQFNCLLQDGDLNEYIGYKVSCKEFDNGNYLITSFSLINSGVGTAVLDKIQQSVSLGGSDYEYDTIYVDRLYVNDNTYLDSVFEGLFTINDGVNFTFNKEFNYNAPMGISVESSYGSGASWTASTEYMAHIDYNVGLFISNGVLYDTIRYDASSTSSQYYKFPDGSIKIGPSGQWSYSFLMYKQSWTDRVDIVNSRDIVAFQPTSSSYAYYQSNSSTWLNDAYRYIKFIGSLSDSNRVKIEAFNNNNQYFGGSINGGSPFDVFGLVGSAFTSLIPLLSIMILPNITLGMLLFVPLVAILVFAIIKIVKK